ncbi:Lsr2 family DNA-binding protein [Aquipuribacter hungaricus]|uniref:Lsr2 family DNA-binding protein n=1 Tax=Aquipuribacter hungaricus TaxID=545624 RepID=UPI0030EE106F
MITTPSVSGKPGQAPFVEKGRRAGGSRSKGTRATSKSSTSTKSADGTDNGAVREWARANGHTVSERGRIKADVVQAYRAANG